MEPPRGTRTVVLCASLVTVGACKSDPKAELAPKVKGYIAAVADLEACVATATHPDFLTSVAFGRAATSFGPWEWLDKCEEAYGARMASFGDTVKRLGIAAPPNVASANLISRDSIPRPNLRDLHDPMNLRKLCDWVHWTHVDIETLAKAAGLAAPKRPECSFGDPYKRQPPMLESIGDHASWTDLASPLVTLRAQTPATLQNVLVFYRSTDPQDSKSLIGHSRDGKAIDTVEVTANTVAVAPAPTGFVALEQPPTSGPVELRVHDGNVWRTVGKLPARDFTQVHAAADLITAVGAPAGQTKLVEVQRSTNGGKTFGAPIRVRDAKADLWSDVRVERDGAVVALGATGSAFTAVRLEPTGKQPQQVAQLTFKEPVKDAQVALCRGSDSYWVLADHRWLLGSSDAGKTWREATDLGASTTPRALYCVADRVLVTRQLDTGIELVACGPTACDRPVAVGRSLAQLLFARAIGKDLELWFEDTSNVTSEAYGGLVWVYRWSNGALAPDRFHLLPTDRNHGLRVMLANLDNTIGWLDPRSGLGELPWRNLATP